MHLTNDIGRLYASCKYEQGQLVYVTNHQLFVGCNFNPVGIENTPTNKGIHIYPNPAISELNVELPENSLTDVKIRDITGRTLLQDQFSGTKHTISLSKLHAGIYLVSIINKQLNHSQKIVLTK